MKTYDELLAERDALAHRLNDVSIACKQSNEMLKKTVAERDALVAQLRLIKNIFRDDSLSPSETLRKIPFVIDLSAEQCLAEIKAEAGRAGFVAGAEMWSDYGVKSRYKDDYLVDIKADASKYAAKIRNTGTWLKDSNVNGGKRQGGE